MYQLFPCKHYSCSRDCLIVFIGRTASITHSSPTKKKNDKNQTASVLKYVSQPDNKYEPIREQPGPGKPKPPYYRNACKQALHAEIWLWSKYMQL